jgi:hypothetical protein
MALFTVALMLLQRMQVACKQVCRPARLLARDLVSVNIGLKFFN